MKATNFFTILEEIKQADSLTDKQRARLLSLVHYLENTKIELLKNITPKRISEVTKDTEKDVLIDTFYYLCGNKWHLLEPIYRYIDEYTDEPIELDEDELAEIRESGYISLNNGNIQVQFDPRKLFITFTISELAKKLKKENVI